MQQFSNAGGFNLPPGLNVKKIIPVGGIVLALIFIFSGPYGQWT